MPETDAPTSCGGHCCRAFCVPIELVTKQAMLGDPESSQILDMLISLGPMTNQEAWKINGGVFEEISHIEGFRPDEVHERYTCKNLLPSGLCGSYETRPQMCRDYPGSSTGGMCEYRSCKLARTSNCGLKDK